MFFSHSEYCNSLTWGIYTFSSFRNADIFQVKDSLARVRGQYTPIIPFAKANGTQLGMSAKELTLLLLTVFLCKYTKVLWLCKSKGFHNYFLRVNRRGS